ncbi:zonular occludens toxin domain-containing protein [Pseudonocardia sp. N23]|uniref:zonular occludens toxin domain-containing protein n=1 Tax=Pseudonocardia sp. N23 TaxID=1987376 RepID=UPI000BFE2857|nr:zonular occludens toxin domain-containing protein [Pseudonocardia sp. N23]GAY11772.1 TraB protein [Pseudonocardia sp. N23]
MSSTTFDDHGPTPDEGPGHDNVISFRRPQPAGPVADDAEPLPLVVDGQVLDDRDDTAEAGQALDRPRAGDRLPVLRRAGRTAARGTVHVITTARLVATHQHTRAAGKALGRNLWYPIAGAGIAAARWRDAHGANRYERMMRAAEIAGDREALLEWEARDAAEKARRHARVMDWITSPLVLVKAFAIATVSFTMLLLGLGVILAVADSDISQVLAPIIGVIDLVRWVAWFLTAYGAFLLLTGTAGALAWLWALGRRHTEPPAWIAPTASDDGPARDVVPDEGAIIAALRNLNLPPLTRKLKEGWTPRWVLGTGRDGRGWRTQLELPPGVTVEMINDRKTVLAHNLVRLPVEVWPTEPKNLPGVLDLWVADQGLLTGPVDPYPLLGEGTTDYFKGVPVGIDQRGDVVTGKLMAANYAAAGIMGSGKTSLVINLLCGAILDPLVDVDVYCMAFNVDYDPLRPRLRTLVKGDEDEHITAAIDALRELRSEVTARGKILAELGGDETKLTREIAERDQRMRPRVVVFDECQELFRHEQFGEEAKQLAIKVMMKARKCGITLLFVTPAPSADSLPRDLAKTVSHRVCFAIGDHQGNDAILGTGAHRQGITATHLVPGEDVGTAMASGFGPRPGLLRTFYIRRDKTVDQLSPIVARALALREAAGISDTPAAPVEPVAVLDPLADIAAVLAGSKRLRTQEVLSLLAARNRPAYGAWTFERLATELPDGAKPYKSGGVMVVSADRVAEAIADRDAEDITDGDGEDGTSGVAG